MAKSSIIAISILGKASSAIKAFRDTNKAAKNTLTTMEKVRSGFSKGVKPAIATLVGLGGAAFKAGQDAAELGDSIDASRIVLGKAQPAVEAFASSAAAAFGISKQSAIDAANAFGTIGSKAGLAGKDLSKFTTDLLARAGDAASMFGGTSEQAVEAFGSALRGEFEPIRKYGVLIDQASLQTKALKLGLIKNIKQALTPQQKALTTQKLILDQTSKAQGNFAQTSDSAKNQQEAFKAELANASAELGTQLLPIMITVTKALREFLQFTKEHKDALKILVPVLGGLAVAVIVVNAAFKASNAVMDTYKGIKKVLIALEKKHIIQKIASTAAMVAQRIAMVAVSAATKAWAAVQWLLNLALTANPIGLIIAGVIALIAVIVLIATKTRFFQTVWGAVWGAIKFVFKATWEWIQRRFKDGVTALILIIDRIKSINVKIATFVAGIVNFFKELPGKLLQIGKDMLQGLVDGISAGIQWVKDKVRGLAFLIPDWLKSVLGISSPSKVMHGLGRNTIRGLADGMSAEQRALMSTVKGIAGGVTKGMSLRPSVDLKTHGRLSISDSALDGAGSGPAYVLNVTVPPTADTAEIGRRIVSAIESFERRTGRRRLARA